MAFLSIEDEYGSVETVVFPKVYSECQSKMIKDVPVLVHGRVDMPDDENGKIKAENITFLNEERSAKENGKKIADTLYLKVKDREELDKTAELLRVFAGNIPVKIRFGEKGKLLGVPQDCFASDDIMLLDGLKILLGDENVVMRYKE